MKRLILLLFVVSCAPKRPIPTLEERMADCKNRLTEVGRANCEQMAAEFYANDLARERSGGWSSGVTIPTAKFPQTTTCIGGDSYVSCTTY